MSEFIVEIKGEFSTDQIGLQIRDEELSFARFLRSSIGTHEGRVTNLVTFRDLPIGQVPPEPILLAADQPPPPGKQQEWSGAMLVSNAPKAVILYR